MAHRSPRLTASQVAGQRYSYPLRGHSTTAVVRQCMYGAGIVQLASRADRPSTYDACGALCCRAAVLRCMLYGPLSSCGTSASKRDVLATLFSSVGTVPCDL